MQRDRDKEVDKLAYKSRKEEATPLFEKAMEAALLAKNWLAMELLARAFNDPDPRVWGLNAFTFIGVTEHWVDKIAQEKGLSSQEVGNLQRDLLEYERE